MIRTLVSLVSLAMLATLVVAVDGPSGSRSARPAQGQTQVIVALAEPAAAYRSDNRATAMRRVDDAQRRFEAALARELPDAAVRRRYRLVLNAIAVTLPAAETARLERLPGVDHVYPVVSYHTATTRSAPRVPAIVGARALQRANGNGIKIGIIDDGIDQTHPFFDPAGYSMPPGFPKGNRAFTTAKVIVARSFAPAGAEYPRARLPFDREESFHGMHVAGIAAGNAGTNANGRKLSGVAPRAWLGNYKALSIPTDAGVGLDGNAPELVAAIEAAVADGMDVINLSLGEPEIEPAEDVVALALDGAAAAGVVPVVAAGNDFDDYGVGSLTSPGSSAEAITAAAVSTSSPPTVASFSSSGPTPISLRLKPDVAAPGVGVLSAAPGGWESLSGTSMAAPYVAGTAALLLERHPDWSPAEVKSALVGTARPVIDEGRPAAPIRGGAGAVDVAGADNPLVLARPSSVSLGLVADGVTSSASVTLSDAGGGAGTWDVAVEPSGASDASVTAPLTVEVPGELQLTTVVPVDARDADVSGAVVLRKAGVVRRIPFWGRLATPLLTSSPTTILARSGVVRGNTSGRPAAVTTYRYPEVPSGGAVTARLAGPEQLFSVTVGKRIANFGVVITSRDRGVTVEPRVVEAADENRLTGYPALPINLNPYLVGFGEPALVAGALSPAPGRYTVVFDSATPAGAGAFTFRFWVDDRRPPTATVVARTVRRGAPIRVGVTDAGSGVDPGSVVARVDGRAIRARVRGSVIQIATDQLARGRHTLRLQVSDYQETRNMENVAAILPNTRVLRTTVTVR